MKNSSDQIELVNLTENDSVKDKSEHQPLLSASALQEESTHQQFTIKSALKPINRFTITPVVQSNEVIGSEDYSDLLLKYVRENRLAKVKEVIDLSNLSKQRNNEDHNYKSITGGATKAELANYFEKINLDIDTHDELKQTPLLIATRLDFSEIALLLMEHDANVNKCDSDSWTPLMNASKNGNTTLCQALIDKKAQIEARDCGNFSPLMWACYKNRVDTVKLLLKYNANPNAQCKNSICCLSWAAGRGYADIVDELLKCKNIKVNLQDQNSSTPLLWAARKGSLRIVKALIECNADPNIAGMLNMTPLLISCKYGHTDVALYLSNLANVNLNHIDKDGNNALQISAKNALPNIVLNLLEKGAYINTPNLKGDNILITAVKGGHKQIIDELLNRHVAIDSPGNQGKTAMHHAIEKGNLEIVKALLNYKPDLEIETNEGDTLLLLATKKKSTNIVSELLSHGSKVSPVDKNGDNVLHISLRNRSREITELILSDPKNSKYLYKPNRHGETPHKIDASNPKSILTQIFGARQLNMTEDNILGYDLYSSALAEILSEPSLHTPITVGIYAKWGSGKSFLLSQLKTEMKSFARLTRVVTMKFKISSIISILLVNLIWTIPFALWKWLFGLCLFLFSNIASFMIIGICKFFHDKKQKEWAERACENLSTQINRFKLFFRILFLNPAKFKSEDDFEHKNLRFIFTEYGKISTLGGENALAYMISSLNTKIENQLGVFITRLCRVFNHKTQSHSKFRRICCIPSFLLCIIIILLVISLVIFFRIRGINIKSFGTEEIAFLLSVLFIICASIFGSMVTWSKIICSIIRSPSSRIQNVIHTKDKQNSNHESKVESIIFKLKKEVDYIAHTIKTIDSFTHGCTRLVIVIDGLDSCEQSKVIQILEIVHVLFTREGDPFICILAVDPHVLIKGIEGNLNAVLRNGNVNGHDYLRTVIHLPVYLQVDLAKARAISKLETIKNGNFAITASQEIVSNDNTADTKIKNKKKKRRNIAKPMSPYDLTDQLLKSDYFLDVNPRNLRRLINIIALTGRLLRAYHIDFNWRVLGSWIYLNEQWPYRCSWINFYYEEHANELTEDTTLNYIYDEIKSQIPTSNEPLLELDRNAAKFEQFLQNCQPNLTAVILKKILPCTCNLDPYLIKLIRESIEANHEKKIHLSTVNSNSSFPIFNNHGTFSQLSQFPKSNSFYASNSVSQIRPNNSMSQMHANNSVNNFFDFVKIDLTKPLEKMTAEDVCDCVNYNIESIDEKCKEIYVCNIKEKNINGKVLLVCDFDELKAELQMTFGDWQLFKNWIITQRLTSIHNSSKINKATNRTNKSIEKFIEKPTQELNKVEFFLRDKEPDNQIQINSNAVLDIQAPQNSLEKNFVSNNLKSKKEQINESDYTDEDDYDDGEIEVQQNGALKPIDQENYFKSKFKSSKETLNESKTLRSNSVIDKSPARKESSNKIQSIKSFISRQMSKDDKKLFSTSSTSINKSEHEVNSPSKATYYIFEDEGDVL